MLYYFSKKKVKERILMRVEHMLCYQALKHYRNFSEAAESLYISQSALSKQLKAMEDELGVALFYRNHSKVKLTPPGERISLHVEAILLEYDQMRLIVKNYIEDSRQKLRIASFYEMVGYDITDLIISFEQTKANFHVESRECDHSQMVNLIETNQMDIAIGYQEFWPQKNNYLIVPFRRDELVMVVNKQHPFAKRETISLIEAKDERFCFPLEDGSLFHFFNDICIASGFVPKLTLSNVRLGTIKRYIAAGMRVTLQSRVRASNFFYESEYQIIGIENAPTLTFAIMANKSRVSETVDQFIQYTQKYYLRS